VPTHPGTRPIAVRRDELTISMHPGWSFEGLVGRICLDAAPHQPRPSSPSIGWCPTTVCTRPLHESAKELSEDFCNVPSCTPRTKPLAERQDPFPTPSGSLTSHGSWIRLGSKYSRDHTGNEASSTSLLSDPSPYGLPCTKRHSAGEAQGSDENDCMVLHVHETQVLSGPRRSRNVRHFTKARLGHMSLRSGKLV